jgi:hypothetical protein
MLRSSQLMRVSWFVSNILQVYDFLIQIKLFVKLQDIFKINFTVEAGYILLTVYSTVDRCLR